MISALSGLAWEWPALKMASYIGQTWNFLLPLTLVLLTIGIAFYILNELIKIFLRTYRYSVYVSMYGDYYDDDDTPEIGGRGIANGRYADGAFTGNGRYADGAFTGNGRYADGAFTGNGRYADGAFTGNGSYADDVAPVGNYADEDVAPMGTPASTGSASTGRSWDNLPRDIWRTVRAFTR